MKIAIACWMLIGLLTPTGAQTIPNSALPPKGYGTLRQADVAIIIRTSDIHISVLPLDERITRLLAPDSYESLHQIRADRRDEIGAAVPTHGFESLRTFLVTLYGAIDYARFDPEQIIITSRNRFFRPLAILPVSARWAEHQIDRGETLTALYVFDRALDPLHPMVIDYRGTRVATWERTLHRLEIERARVEARARGTPGPNHDSTSPEAIWPYIH